LTEEFGVSRYLWTPQGQKLGVFWTPWTPMDWRLCASHTHTDRQRCH